MLWPRVDQKTCLKSITAAGFEVVPIPMQRLAGTDELTTDVGAIQKTLEELGAEQVAVTAALLQVLQQSRRAARHAAAGVSGMLRACTSVYC